MYRLVRVIYDGRTIYGYTIKDDRNVLKNMHRNEVIKLARCGKVYGVDFVSGILRSKELDLATLPKVQAKDFNIDTNDYINMGNNKYVSKAARLSEDALVYSKEHKAYGIVTIINDDNIQVQYNKYSKLYTRKDMTRVILPNTSEYKLDYTELYGVKAVLVERVANNLITGAVINVDEEVYKRLISEVGIKLVNDPTSVTHNVLFSSMDIKLIKKLGYPIVSENGKLDNRINCEI